MKKFLAGVVVGSIGTFGMLLVEAEKKHGAIKRIAARAFRMYADKLDPKWEHDYADYNTDYSRLTIEPIEYPSKEIAENVLEQLRDKLKRNNAVLVADYMKISNQTPNYIQYKWGWIDLHSAYVYGYNSNGVDHWAIYLPEPVLMAI